MRGAAADSRPHGRTLDQCRQDDPASDHARPRGRARRAATATGRRLTTTEPAASQAASRLTATAAGRPSGEASPAARRAGHAQAPPGTRCQRRATRRDARPRTRRTVRLATGPFRLWSAFCVVAFVLSLFAARLIQLQGIDENDYAAMAVEKGAQTVTLEAPRASDLRPQRRRRSPRRVDAAKLVGRPDVHHDNAIADRDRTCTTGSAPTTSRRSPCCASPTPATSSWPATCDPRRRRPAVVALPRSAELAGVYVDKDTAAGLPGGRHRREPGRLRRRRQHRARRLRVVARRTCSRARTARRRTRWPTASSCRSPTTPSSSRRRAPGSG